MTEPLTFTVPGVAQPKERPRQGKGGRFYTPKDTRGYEQVVRVHWLAAAARVRWSKIPVGVEAAVTLRFFMPNRRVKDSDNLAKGVLDAINKLAWHDDSQVTELHVYREIDPRTPRVEVTIGCRE